MGLECATSITIRNGNALNETFKYNPFHFSHHDMSCTLAVFSSFRVMFTGLSSYTKTTSTFTGSIILSSPFRPLVIG